MERIASQVSVAMDLTIDKGGRDWKRNRKVCAHVITIPRREILVEEGGV